MMTLPGYQIIEKIYSSDRSEVYRALQESNHTSVILKFMTTEYPSFSELVKFRHQYSLTKNLDIAGIIRPLGLKNHGNGYVLVMEDFGGVSLKDYTQNHLLPMREFFPIAIQLVQTLDRLAQHRIIHKDIKPDNILINPDTKQVKLTDFSIASLLPRETQQLLTPNVLEGTLAYISPEQTGRMNRGIDYRTDFYCLGVTFYELLTGQLPFDATDPMELIHCHMTKMPIALKNRQLANGNQEEIPPVLSEIVIKLMAKNAEDRYQSAIGILADLETCLNQYTATGKIDPFPLGAKDISDRFMIPEKLYGRETEVQILLDAFEQVTNPPETTQTPLLQGRPGGVKLMLVAGFSGIGKSALVHEVHKPIVRKRGYFIQGKYDQFQRNIPLSAIVRAFSDLIRQLLGESEESVKQWQAKILKALGKKAQVIIDVIPELELLIGQQPAVKPLPAIAAKNRFNLLFQKFIQVFTSTEHPLVIFLDDLQWADSASLQLIQWLLNEKEINYLLVIGAYRDNEVSPTHPLMLTLQSIEADPPLTPRTNKNISSGLPLPNAIDGRGINAIDGRGINAIDGRGIKGGDRGRNLLLDQSSLETITLRPLDFHSLNRLIADTIKCSQERAIPLTELVDRKTKGNPFFATQFLKSLYERGIISYVRETPANSQQNQSIVNESSVTGGYWQCDIAQLKSLSISDDVVEFMATQLQKLPDKTQNVLKLAACIDNQFDLQTLAIISEQSLVQTASNLWSALQEGLILPTSQAYKFFSEADSEDVAKIQDCSLEYKFLHDRVQQAAYSLIREDEKQSYHLKIGQLLLSHTPLEERSAKIFDIVNQLNYGVELLDKESDRLQLAELNLTAGQKAKASMAYASAWKYLNTGVELLPADSWNQSYELTLNLYLELAETEYFNTNYEECDRLSQVILAQAKSWLDKIKVYELNIQISTAKNQLQEAIDIGLDLLQSLDVTLAKAPSEGLIIKELHKLPRMTDVRKLAALRILMTIAPPAYNANPSLIPLLTLTMVNLCIEFGNSPLAAYAYGFYGMLLCSEMEDIEAGYEFGQQALQVVDQFDDSELKGKVYHLVNVGIRHWQEPAQDTIAPWLETIQFALEAGDIEYACYAAMGYCVSIFLVGEPLDSVVEKQAEYMNLMRKLKQEFPLTGTSIWGQIALNLVELSENPSQLMGELANEEIIVPVLRDTNNIQTLFVVYLGKTFLSYLFKDYRQAVANAEIASEYQQAMAGLLAIAQYPFYESLALLALYPELEKPQQSAYLAKVAANQEKMQGWANYAPINFQHKYDLVAAEKARILGEYWQATEFYERAITGANEAGYIQEEALAYELAAEFYLKCDRAKIAQSYMIDAYYCYSRWGAKAKVASLEQTYPDLLNSILSSEPAEFRISDTFNPTSTSIISRTSTSNSAILDLLSAIKAAQALSGEIHLEQLLAKLMQVSQENAGADKCAIILPQETEWSIATLNVEDHQSYPAIRFPPYEGGLGGIAPKLKWSNLADSREIPVSIVHYVQRTQESLIIDDASSDVTFAADPYITEHQPKSLLCMPFRNRGQVVGLLYLENQLISNAFSRDRLEILNLFTSQAAISVENAKLYDSLEQQVEQRTQELNEKNIRLKEAIKELKRTQSQLIYTEKMSSLGQIVAGIAHEINNPVSFIYGNIDHTNEYVEDLINLLNLYQEKYPDPDPDIESEIEAIDLEFLEEDLQKILQSMKGGAERIGNIVRSLRNFSRLDEADMKQVDIHEGIESTLMLLQSRLDGGEKTPKITVIKQYGKLPKITCYASAINQVFMNILSNACDVLTQQHRQKLQLSSSGDHSSHNPTIRISTAMTNAYFVQIRIADNGPGITSQVLKKIFDPFFTTKPVGSGTGLGLSISYQIIVEKHRGQLHCISEPGQGAEFTIEIPVQPKELPARDN